MFYRIQNENTIGMNEKESLKRRHESILGEVKRRGFESVVFSKELYHNNPLNFVYAAGAWGYGHEHAFLILDVNGGSTLVIKHWRKKELEGMGIYDRVLPAMQSKKENVKEIKDAIERYHNPKKVCFDFSTMSGDFTCMLLKGLGFAPSLDLDISEYVFKLRGIKDEYEIGELKKAAKITEDAIVELALDAKPGVSTVDLKRRLEASMMEKGAMDFPFLDAGVSIARVPSPNRTTIKYGDLIGVDHGCRVMSGYTCDMNRSIPIGLSSELREYLNRAIEAHKEGLKLIRHGAIGNEIYEKIVEINVEHGFGPVQRGGHHIGLGAHDDLMPYVPTIGPLEEDRRPLLEGMTLNYEPFHADEKAGYTSSFEDVVLVTKGDPIVLTELPWDFLW